MAFGISLGKSSSSNKVKIPSWLRPLYEQGANIVQTGMSDLQSLSSPMRDFIAGFTPQEEAAQIIGTDRALGGGGFFPTAQEVFMSTAEGTPISEYLPGATMSTLEQLAAGSTDPAVRARLTELMNAGDLPGMDTLSQIEGGINPLTREGLEATARGDFLYGGEAFNRAIEAAMNAFKPELLSTFGGSGPGGWNSTLAQEALGRAFSDTFASQYGSERGNQLSALEQLANLDFTDRGLRADIASRMGELGLAGRTSDMSAATSLAGIDAADAGTRLSAAGRIGDYADRERDRQLGAAAALPELATADINLLSGIGEDIRGLEQERLDAPRQAQLQMLSLLFPGLNLNDLLGRKASGSSAALGFDTP